MNSSFASAEQFPLKVIRRRGLVDRVREGAIPPVHVQFLPMNRCNLKCGFCSCKARDRGQEMTLEQAREIGISVRPALGAAPEGVTLEMLGGIRAFLSAQQRPIT